MRVLIAIVGFVFLWTTAALAQEHNHPPAHAELHDQFYSSWMRPDQPNVSCCNKQDCAPAEARMVGTQWFARHLGKEKWLSIPEAKIEQRRDSPDGRTHLCAMGETVFCFLAGAGI